MNKIQEKELFELSQSFNENQSFPFARHIWLICYRLGVDPPRNVLDVFIKGLENKDKNFKTPLKNKIDEFNKQTSIDFKMWDYINDYISDNKSTTTEAIEAYSEELRKEGNNKETYYQFDNLKKRYDRFNKKMNDTIEQSSKITSKPMSQEDVDYELDRIINEFKK